VYTIEDLWQSLSEASGKDVEKVMKTWTEQMGFPVLNVTETQVGIQDIIKSK
jgi:aminopeptidase N